jgi:hypothetical protein
VKRFQPVCTVQLQRGLRISPSRESLYSLLEVSTDLFGYPYRPVAVSRPRERESCYNHPLEVSTDLFGYPYGPVAVRESCYISRSRSAQTYSDTHTGLQLLLLLIPSSLGQDPVNARVPSPARRLLFPHEIWGAGGVLATQRPSLHPPLSSGPPHRHQICDSSSHFVTRQRFRN